MLRDLEVFKAANIAKILAYTMYLMICSVDRFLIKRLNDWSNSVRDTLKPVLISTSMQLRYVCKLAYLAFKRLLLIHARLFLLKHLVASEVKW